jgi:hypothetical protein
LLTHGREAWAFIIICNIITSKQFESFNTIAWKSNERRAQIVWGFE